MGMSMNEPFVFPERKRVKFPLHAGCKGVSHCGAGEDSHVVSVLKVKGVRVFYVWDVMGVHVVKCRCQDRALGNTCTLGEKVG